MWFLLQRLKREPFGKGNWKKRLRKKILRPHNLNCCVNPRKKTLNVRGKDS